MGVDGHVPEEIAVECFAGEMTPDTERYVPGSDFEDDFIGDKFHVSWNFIHNPVEQLVHFNNKRLYLHGAAASISCDEYKSILVRRQERSL